MSRGQDEGQSYNFAAHNLVTDGRTSTSNCRNFRRMHQRCF